MQANSTNCLFFYANWGLAPMNRKMDRKEKDMAEPRRDSARSWVLAARPKTLTGAAVPVMIGLSMAFADRSAAMAFHWLPAVLCLLFAFIMQIDANFINDYFDFKHGNDDETRLGPKRACAMGWVTVRNMKHAIVITTALACLVGLPLIWYGGVEMIAVGLFCVVFCFLYTTHLSYLGLGDLLVLVFFGIIPVCVPYYIQMHAITGAVVVASVACGLVIDTLLVVNNYRDIDNDRKNGKITLIVRMGARMGRLFYLLLGVVACGLGIVHIQNVHPMAFVLPFVYLIFHIVSYRQMVRIDHGRELNIILGYTARNMLIYGLLVSIGMLI